MEKLSELDIRLDALYGIINGRIKTQLLVTAIELKIFDYLSAPQSGRWVAGKLSTHPVYTTVLLDGLAALNLLEKKEGCYQNLPDTQKVLNTQSQAYIGEMFSLMDKKAAAVLADMAGIVRSGPGAASADPGNEAVWEAYARSLANFQRTGIAGNMAARIAQLREFHSFENMLDLGGGPGLYCIAMVGEHPCMRGVVFDQPSVVKVAEEFIAGYGMSDRIQTMAGDYVNDAIGENYDLIWASATLNVVRRDLDTMIKKIFHALKPGGVFASLSDGVTRERTRPEEYVLGFMPWMFSGQDLMFDSKEVAGAMKRAGFSSVESTIVKTPMMPMELDIARK